MLVFKITARWGFMIFASECLLLSPSAIPRVWVQWSYSAVNIYNISYDLPSPLIKRLTDYHMWSHTYFPPCSNNRVTYFRYIHVCLEESSGRNILNTQSWWIKNCTRQVEVRIITKVKRCWHQFNRPVKLAVLFNTLTGVFMSGVFETLHLILIQRFMSFTILSFTAIS